MLCEVSKTRRVLDRTVAKSKGTLQKRRYSAKETYDFKEPTNRSHPIAKNTRVSRYVRYQRQEEYCIVM